MADKKNPKTLKDIRKKIDQLLENDDKRNEIGVSARNHILENFSVETIVARNLEFYKKICH